MTQATFFATLRYRDARRAHTWLADAFGLEPGVIMPPAGDHVDHAVTYCGSGGIMFGSPAENDYALGTGGGDESVGIYVVVDDADSLCAKGGAAGAEITIDIRATDYGSREFTARDLEGHLWLFGTYQPQRRAN